jgi:hypothetical protein
LAEEHGKSPELNLFAQLCGLTRIDLNIYDVFNALRTCISIGEKGYGVALALLNVVLGGASPVPDLVTVVPPGFLRFVKRIELINDIVLAELLPDVPLPRGVYSRDITVGEGGEESRFRITVERFPRAFGIYIEYEHPVYGVTRLVIVVYDAGTGDYPLKMFIAPQSVAEAVARMLEEHRPLVSYEPLEKLFAKAEKVLRSSGSAEKATRILRSDGVRVEQVVEKPQDLPP